MHLFESPIERKMSESDEKSIGRLQREAQLYRDEFQRRGVIYMSRVPPFMKPNKAKSIFEQYGEVTRLYLAEEGRRIDVSPLALPCITINVLLSQTFKLVESERNTAEMDQSNLKKVRLYSFVFMLKCMGLTASPPMTLGWIEFADKKIAKQVAESLNNTPIGGKKGDFYHDDIWNLKYLKGFK